MSQFAAGISETCFAASYIVVWLLECSRLLFHSAVRQVVLLAFAGAGLLAHTMYLWWRALEGEGAPLSSSFDWYLMAAWMLTIAYIYVMYFHPTYPIGLFLIPLVLVLVGAATFFADRRPFPPDEAVTAWVTLHAIFLLLGTVAVMFGFAAGTMYLLQVYSLKHKRLLWRRIRFPSLEWLEMITSRMIVVSVLTFAFGFVSGVVLNVVHRGRTMYQVPWTDPVVWSSGVMVLWLLAAGIFCAVYRPARQGRKIAYLTLASFVLLVFAMAMRLFVETGHQGGGETHGAAAGVSESTQSSALDRFSPGLQSPSRPMAGRLPSGGGAA